MDIIEEHLQKKMSPEDFELLMEIINLPISRIRSYIQKMVDEVENK